MRRRKIETWVVYRNNNKQMPSNAVCTQGEWEHLEKEYPGIHAIIQGGFSSEGEAEKLARGTSGDRVPRARPPFKGPLIDVPSETGAAG